MHRYASATTLAALLVTLAAPAAVAVGFDGYRTGAKAHGEVKIDTTARIAGIVEDTRADGKCARLRGNWDLPFLPDHGFAVAEACGNGNDTYGYNKSDLDGRARDLEVRLYTGDDFTVIWEGTGDDA